MNIYQGCTHGCIYCDSRSRCYQFTHPFEDIEVKQDAPELLEKVLKLKRKKCMQFVLDGGTDDKAALLREQTVAVTKYSDALVRG